MSRPPRGIPAFLDFVRGQCAEHGITLVYKPGDSARNGDVGSFDHESKRLVTFVGRADWLLNLAHEMGHLRQFVERRAFYCSSAADVEAFFSWCAGKQKVTARRLLRMTRAIQRIENDANRRGLRFVRDFHLGDAKAFAREFNLYVWRYEVARRAGFWPRWGPARHELIRAMPTRIIPMTAIGKAPEFLERMALRPRDAAELERTQ